MSEDADDIRAVFVKQKTTSFELGEERMDCPAYRLELLERYVFFDVWHPPEISGLDAIV